MTKIQDAIRIRDRVFRYVKKFGSLEVYDGWVSLGINEGCMCALFSKRPSPAETWGLDIWVRQIDSIPQIVSPVGKVMNLQWNAEEKYDILSFRRGNWEQIGFLAPLRLVFSKPLVVTSQEVSNALRLQLPHATSFEKKEFLVHQ